MGSLYRSKTPPSESILDMSVMKLMRPMKLFHLDDDQNSSYREYLTTNFGRVRVHCQKPQPNFFSNLGCIEEIKRRLRLNNNASTSLLFRHLLDDNDQDVLMASSLAAEPEDGEIESDEEKTPVNANGKGPKSKSVHNLSDDENEKQVRKKSKLNDDGTGDLSKSTSSEKPWWVFRCRSRYRYGWIHVLGWPLNCECGSNNGTNSRHKSSTEKRPLRSRRSSRK